MPEWLHNRAEHLLAKNPSMNKATAFAVATQQSHAKGKTPKSYGTKAGKQEAKAKFDKPKKEYEATANPGKLESPKMGKEKNSSPASDAYGGSQESDKVAARFYAIEKQALDLSALKGGLKRVGSAVSQGVSRITRAGSTAAHEAAPALQAARPAAPTTSNAAHLFEQMKAVGAPALDPDLVGAAHQQLAYHRLPFRVKHLVNKTPLVQAGMPASAAAAVAGWGAGGGEDYAGAVMRAALAGSGKAVGPQGRVARNAARAVRREAMSAATKAASASWAGAFFDEMRNLSGGLGYAKMAAKIPIRSLGIDRWGQSIPDPVAIAKQVDRSKGLLHRVAVAVGAKKSHYTKALERATQEAPKMAEVEEWHDQVPGGKADEKKPEDFDQVQLAKGMMVEREHVGDDLDRAEEIAMDHLTEFPDYYTELKKMETKMDKKASVMFGAFFDELNKIAAER